MTLGSDHRWSINGLTGCWQWNLYIDPRGYGRLTWAGRGGVLAHRWSYEYHIGPIPEGMTVDHLCFNTSCVNPAHLRLLTFSDNSRNQRSARSSHCKNGHELTPENTYIKPRPGDGRRQCRKCQLAAVKKYQAKTRRAA